jgi:toxin ParE1/3/4
MNIKILSDAEHEFIQTIEYYNEQCSGLGYDFATEVTKTLERISSYPKAWPQISPRTRRCLTNKFPFGVIYQIRIDCILVIAIMHLKRNPVHWKKRL